jgi:hypothetical protein
VAKPPGGRAALRHETVEGRVQQRHLHRRRGLRQRADSRCGVQVENLIADRDPDMKGVAGATAAEHPEGKILNREIGAGKIGRLHPGAASRVMGFVEAGGFFPAHSGHSSSGSRNEQEPKPWKNSDRVDATVSSG